MIGVNMQTSFLTPPFGFALFYLRGVAPIEVKTTDIYKGVVAFILLQLVALGIVGTFPSLVNFLPNQSFLTADTAPPPKNPRLQQCIEQHLFAVYDESGDALKAQIQTAMRLDISYLPEKRQTELAKSFDMALGTFDLVTVVRAAAAEVEKATVNYRPIHTGVRRLQQQARDIDAEIAELTNDIRRLKNSEATIPSDISDDEDRIAALKAEKIAVLNEIPESWEAEQKQFVSLLTAEKKARRDYRRNVDRAYEPVQKTLAVALSGSDLASISADIEALSAIAETGSVEEVKAALKAARKALSGAAPDISAINSVLTKADRALKKNGKGREKTVEFVAEAIDLYKAEVTWRERAATDLFTDLTSYDDAIKNSIGLRLQDRLPTSIARNVAACRAKHTDISLNF
jgi:hypothetical protein